MEAATSIAEHCPPWLQERLFYLRVRQIGMLRFEAVEVVFDFPLIVRVQKILASAPGKPVGIKLGDRGGTAPMLPIRRVSNAKLASQNVHSKLGRSVRPRGGDRKQDRPLARGGTSRRAADGDKFFIHRELH
jgi:hypothetical protein